MIPFCRRVEEARRVVERMRELGLERGENGLEIYVMCEIPNNVMLIDEFCRHLRRLLDRLERSDAARRSASTAIRRLVAFDFDERDPGVKEMIRHAVTGAHRNGRHSASAARRRPTIRSSPSSWWGSASIRSASIPTALFRPSGASGERRELDARAVVGPPSNERSHAHDRRGNRRTRFFDGSGGSNGIGSVRSRQRKQPEELAQSVRSRSPQ